MQAEQRNPGPSTEQKFRIRLLVFIALLCLLALSILVLAGRSALLLYGSHRMIGDSTHQEEGNAALREQGRNLLYGIGCPIDQQRAEQLFREAYQAGDKLSGGYLYMVIRHKVLSEDEQNEQGRLWRDCKPAIYGAAYQGDMDGKFLAAMRQKYVLDDNTEAVRLWRKEIGEASDAGFPPAMVERGYRILDGDVWDYDVNEAMDWFRKAHEAGCLAGTGGMGATAALNDYSGREKPLMIEYLRQAADGGDPMGNLTLGNMYYYGDGLPLDYGQALEYYRRTAEAGGSNGYRYVARILIRGLAGPADLAGGRAALETSLGYGEDEEKLALLAELEELEAAAGR